jgi:PAS domain S-box-containing protein
MILFAAGLGKPVILIERLIQSGDRFRDLLTCWTNSRRRCFRKVATLTSVKRRAAKTPPFESAIREAYDGLLASMSASPKENRPSQAASAAALVMDGTGMIVEWTRDAEATFGWSRAEAVGKRLSELIIPERLRAAHEAGLKYFLAGGPGTLIDRALKIVAIDRAGSEFSVEFRITAEQSDHGYRFATSARRVD